MNRRPATVLVHDVTGDRQRTTATEPRFQCREARHLLDQRRQIRFDSLDGFDSSPIFLQ